MPDGLPRLDDVVRGRELAFTYEGETIEAFDGESVAGALLAAGYRSLRRTPRTGEARGLFCSMGVCFDCVVRVDGATTARACVTPVRDGMAVTSQ